jgi:hypothetical protein
MSGSADDKAVRERLLGTWTLVSAIREDSATGEKADMWGANPHGFINYSPDGRMMALITRANRKAPAGAPSAAEAETLFRSMMSYGGTYAIEGNVVTHHVDISWNQSFTGGEQKRTFTLDGDLLKLMTPQSRDPIDGKLSVRTMTWKKL